MQSTYTPGIITSLFISLPKIFVVLTTLEVQLLNNMPHQLWDNCGKAQMLW